LVRISTVIIARDEEARLERCVRPCLAFSDEVVVVDGGSSDGTRELAERLGCRVIENPWPGYSEQRNLGAREAANDWIFSVDADEIVDEELGAALERVRASDSLDRVGYSVLRVNAFLGARLEDSPETKVRLYDRRAARFNDRLVHELVDLRLSEAGHLPGALVHERPDNLADAMQRLNLYTSLEADIAAAERPERAWRLLLRPPARFGQRFVVQRGYRLGWRGLFLALYWAWWEALREMKVYERRRRP
jgi:glycosyltransferase involved in cell wall biosynthesis